VSLSPETFDRTMKVVSGMASTAQSSMLTDLQAGKPLEIKWFSGELVRLGQKHGIATPVHQAFAVAMTPFENGQ
jgi:2-dehydropantoate 2-reductase